SQQQHLPRANSSVTARSIFHLQKASQPLQECARACFFPRPKRQQWPASPRVPDRTKDCQRAPALRRQSGTTSLVLLPSALLDLVENDVLSVSNRQHLTCRRHGKLGLYSSCHASFN